MTDLYNRDARDVPMMGIPLPPQEQLYHAPPPPTPPKPLDPKRVRRVWYVCMSVFLGLPALLAFGAGGSGGTGAGMGIILLFLFACGMAAPWVLKQARKGIH
jgi:hypothetical protein